MKAISFTSTIIFHFLIILSLKLLDNFNSILIIFLFSILIGLTIKLLSKNRSVSLNHLGWGILYGSITTVSLLLISITLLGYNFPK